VADAAPTSIPCLILLLAYGGLRIGRATALRVSNGDLLRGKVRIVEAYSEVGGRLVLAETKTQGSRRAASLCLIS
jgi:integrase